MVLVVVVLYMLYCFAAVFAVFYLVLLLPFLFFNCCMLHTVLCLHGPCNCLLLLAVSCFIAELLYILL